MVAASKGMRGVRGAGGARGATGARGAAGTRGERGRVGDGGPPRSHERAALPRAGAGGGSGGWREAKPAPPSWGDPRFGGRLDELKALGDEAVALQLERARLDEKIKEKTILARALMEDINSDQGWSVADEAWTCAYVKPKPRKSLVRELLVQAGVTMKQIEKGTKETPVTPYAMFVAKGAAKQPWQEEE